MKSFTPLILVKTERLSSASKMAENVQSVETVRNAAVDSDWIIGMKLSVSSLLSNQNQQRHSERFLRTVRFPPFLKRCKLGAKYSMYRNSPVRKVFEM